jgi:hypothetical protein
MAVVVCANAAAVESRMTEAKRIFFMGIVSRRLR